MDKSITIPGFGPLPLSTLEGLASFVPVVTDGLRQGKSATEIKADLEARAPAVLLSVAESVLSIAFPGGGALLAALAWMIENSQNGQMTQDQVNTWMDRFGAGNA